jgi:hypothetical protein
MDALNPTAPEHLVDERGRPYFLWDVDMTLDRFRELLRSGDPELRAYLVGKLMRQAKPDDVFSFVSLEEIRAVLPGARRHLGRSGPFWEWLLDVWKDDRAA